MCGIVGHIGSENSSSIVLKGLKRLEYRGYDSAGISFKNNTSQVETYKKVGKISNLENFLEDKNTASNLCIGHTRWATHGGVTDFNSHPHQYEEISIVHNGIIENADDLKSEELLANYEYKSETDSEVFLALVTRSFQKTGDMKAAVVQAFSKIKGNSAFVVMNSKTDEIVAIKRSAPLVCAANNLNKGKFVSSDPYALAGMADELFFPEDEVLCYLSRKESEIQFLDLKLDQSENYSREKQKSNDLLSEKGDFEHFMLKEIHEQPELIERFIAHYMEGAGKEYLDQVKKLNPKSFKINACGTAYYAGLIVADYLEVFNKIPTQCFLSSEFRYRNPLLNKDDVGLFISQSGETADTLAAAELCKEQGLDILSLVNVEGSTLYRLCDENLLIQAGVEIGVASTKAFTQMVLTGRLLSAALSGELEDSKKLTALTTKFSLLSQRINELLEKSHFIKEIAEALYNQKGYLFTGRGMYYPVALEGALKLKEIAYVHAEGYASGELKHGPIALIDEKMVNLAIVGPELMDKTISNVQEIKARKGVIVTLGPENNKNLEALSDYYFPLNFNGLEELAPLYVNIVQQLFAYYMAKFKGHDIDQPRNLAKSVTVE